MISSSSTRCCTSSTIRRARSGEAARALAPGGRLVVVDFDAHDQEFLRDEFAHRRLGFAVHEIEGYLAEAGLADVRFERVAAGQGRSRQADGRAVDRARIRASFPIRSQRATWSSPDGRETASAEPRRRAGSGLVRVLPAEDRRDGGELVGGGDAPRAARARPSSRSPTAPAARRASAPMRWSSAWRARRRCSRPRT